MKEFKGTQSVERTFRVLECFSMEKSRLDLFEIAHMTQLSKSTVYRLLQTMLQSGYIKQDPDTQKYSLGFKLFHLGAMAGANFNLKEVALPYMRELCNQVSETINLNIIYENQRVCIEIVESPEAIRNIVKVGERNHLCLGPSGKVMLAHLPEAEKQQVIAQAKSLNVLAMEEVLILIQELNDIRNNGFATEIDGRVKGAFAIAAPLLDQTGQPIGSITASGPTQRLSKERMSFIIERVIRAGNKISEAMGFV